jgi:hypothetical protein
MKVVVAAVGLVRMTTLVAAVVGLVGLTVVLVGMMLAV